MSDTQLIPNKHNEDNDNRVVTQYEDGDGMIQRSIETRVYRNVTWVFVQS
jgi:hypothetical protein